MLGRGRYLGLRKIDEQRSTWIARLRTDSGAQTYRSLGYLTPEYDYEQAKAEAQTWFKSHEAGVTDAPATVEACCKDYVEDRRREKGEATARDAEARFERTVYETTFGRMRVDKIRSADVRRWRDNAALGKASANRTLSSLKAALNLAVSNRRVTADRRIEWADVKPYKDATTRRTLFLDLPQRRKLLAAAGNGALRDLLEAAMATGARAGELVNAPRSAFDARTGSMTFTGKTGTRTVPLSPAALKLFTRLAKAKLPAARLLVRDDGEPWNHSDWDELVKAAAAKAKLPTGTVLYTLRHSFITTALTAGMTTLDVARLVGTSLMMIEKHYGHLVAGAASDRLKLVELV
ncbi:MAG: tyrosine-type recombinase/integrase [Pseudomonadota bacterium]